MVRAKRKVADRDWLHDFGTPAKVPCQVQHRVIMKQWHGWSANSEYLTRAVNAAIFRTQRVKEERSFHDAYTLSATSDAAHVGECRGSDATSFDQTTVFVCNTNDKPSHDSGDRPNTADDGGIFSPLRSTIAHAPTGFSTAKGTRVTVSESARAQAAHLLDGRSDAPRPQTADDGGIPPPLRPTTARAPTGFSTAKGTRVTVSESARAQAARLLDGRSDAPRPQSPHQSSNCSNSNSSSTSTMAVPRTARSPLHVVSGAAGASGNCSRDGAPSSSCLSVVASSLSVPPSANGRRAYPYSRLATGPTSALGGARSIAGRGKSRLNAGVTSILSSRRGRAGGRGGRPFAAPTPVSTGLAAATTATNAASVRGVSSSLPSFVLSACSLRGQAMPVPLPGPAGSVTDVLTLPTRLANGHRAYCTPYTHNTPPAVHLVGDGSDECNFGGSDDATGGGGGVSRVVRNPSGLVVAAAEAGAASHVTLRLITSEARLTAPATTTLGATLGTSHVSASSRPSSEVHVETPKAIVVTQRLETRFDAAAQPQQEKHQQWAPNGRRSLRAFVADKTTTYPHSVARRGRFALQRPNVASLQAQGVRDTTLQVNSRNASLLLFGGDDDSGGGLPIGFSGNDDELGVSNTGSMADATSDTTPTGRTATNTAAVTGSVGVVPATVVIALSTTDTVIAMEERLLSEGGDTPEGRDSAHDGSGSEDGSGECTDPANPASPANGDDAGDESNASRNQKSDNGWPDVGVSPQPHRDQPQDQRRVRPTYRDKQQRGVDPRLLGDPAWLRPWVRNHLRWIIWTLASMERSLPMPGLLARDLVFARLKQRWAREVVQAEPSPVRRVLQRDVSSQHLIVLCVASIGVNGSTDQSAMNRRAPAATSSSTDARGVTTLELSDGWCVTPIREGAKGVIKRAQCAEAEFGVSHPPPLSKAVSDADAS